MSIGCYRRVAASALRLPPPRPPRLAAVSRRLSMPSSSACLHLSSLAVRRFCWVRRPLFRAAAVTQNGNRQCVQFTRSEAVANCCDAAAASPLLLPSSPERDTVYVDGDGEDGDVGEDSDFPSSGLKVGFDQELEHNCSKSFYVGCMVNANCRALGTDGTSEARRFPYLDQFKVKDTTLTSSEVKQMLSPFIADERKKKIEKVVANRTYSVCIVVEGLLDLGNVAAVFRSADALGFQSVHVISNETAKRYKKNRKVSMGSEKWLDVELSSATRPCLEKLRARGYRIAVASVADDTGSMLDMDWTIPTAIVFGNEMHGVSVEAMEMADMKCSIPMAGMVDSFNVSVAAGIVMHHAVHDRINRMAVHGDLSTKEQEILCADFYLRHSSKTLSVLNRLVEKKRMEFIANNERNETNVRVTLRSVLRGELEEDVELPEYLKVDLEKVKLKIGSA